MQLKTASLLKWAFLVAQMVKNLPAMREIWVRSLGREDHLEKEMATHSSILAWRIPWTEEPVKNACLGKNSKLTFARASLVAQMVKNPPAMQETQVWSLGWEDPLEKEMATHSSILAWRIPWTEEPGGLQSMGSQSGGHDSATNTFASLPFVLSTSMLYVYSL